MGQRVVNRVYDSTSGAGAAITADIVTEYIDGLILAFVSAGAAAPTDTTYYYFDETGSPGVGAGLAAPGAKGGTLATSTGAGIAGNIAYSLGVGSSNPVHLGRRMRFTVTGGAASTVRMVIYTVKYQ